MDNLSIIQNVINAVMKGNGTDAVLKEVANAAVSLCNSTWASIGVLNRASGVMHIQAYSLKGTVEFVQGLDVEVTEALGEGITAYVAAIGKPYLSGDVTQDSHYRPGLANTMSELAVPVFSHDGRVQGVVNVESEKTNAFTNEHLRNLELLASVVATQLRLDRYYERQQALIKVGAALPISSDEESLLEKVMQVADNLLHFEASSIFLLDELLGTFVLRASQGVLSDNINKAAYQPGEGLTGWVAANGKPIRVSKPQSDSRWTGKFLEFPADEIGAYLAAPILTRDRCVGVIRVVRHHSVNPWIDNAFTSDDEDVLMAIAGQLGTGLRGLRMVNRLLRAERMAAWGELSAKAAHVLGNSVFALEGDINEFRYLVTENKQDTRESLKELLVSMENGVTRLEETLAEFRDFVMATQIQMDELDINDLLRKTVKETFPKRSSIKLLFELQADLPQTYGDSKKLKSSFSEIIENSFHFQEEGVITIRSEYISPERVPNSLGLVIGRGYIKIEFQDQGEGVPDERKKQIFSPFSTTRVKGMGLGLSIVKGIVDAHEGLIYEDGIPGKGARFVIYLPIKKAKEGKVDTHA